MKRPAVGFIICVGGWVMGGCVRLTGSLAIHPHSAVTAPTFCLFVGSDEPGPIGEIKVYPRGEYKPAWFIEYDPDPAQPYVRPLACITYGKLPPGYREKAPAIPLTPEKLYRVNLRTKNYGYMDSLRFIIRLGPNGEPVRLEYIDDGSRFDDISSVSGSGDYIRGNDKREDKVQTIPLQ